MADDGAKLDSKEDGKEGVAPPKSQGEGKAPGDDLIPSSRLAAAVANAVRTTEQRMQAQIDELKAAKAKQEEKKPPTRAELKQLVASGDLTEEQSDAIWEKQIVDAATAKAAAQVNQSVSAQERERRVLGELKGFKEVVPEVWDETSPEYAKVAAEFNRLVDEGHPSTKSTELAALRIAFGDLETLKASKSARSGSSETHSETGGGKPPPGPKNDVLKNLSPERKKHYTRLVEQGIYKDWDAVKEELKDAKPRRSAR